MAKVRLVVMDVDGVMTDGTLTYDETGNEMKRFHVMDGVGITLLRLVGIPVIWVSGRKSGAVERRAKELKLAGLYEAARDKRVALKEICEKHHLLPDELAFVADDINDILAFEGVGVRFAVANAATEVKQRADAITEHFGGNGAVREVCEAILEAWGLRQTAIEKYLAMLCEEQTASSGQ
jgi:3-deoxy-D-manno-octulosonate 8-phosphate phosphatase (KDO 8-P phosphatase)